MSVYEVPEPIINSPFEEPLERDNRDRSIPRDREGVDGMARGERVPHALPGKGIEAPRIVLFVGTVPAHGGLERVYEHVAGGVANARDIGRRAIGVLGIGAVRGRTAGQGVGQSNLAARAEFANEIRARRKEPPLPVRHWAVDGLDQPRGPQTPAGGRQQGNPPALKPARGVESQGGLRTAVAGQPPRRRAHDRSRGLWRRRRCTHDRRIRLRRMFRWKITRRCWTATSRA